MTDYVKRFLALRKELEGKRGLADVMASKGPKARAASLKRAEKTLGCSIPGAMADFFSQMDGWSIQWRWPGLGPLGTTVTGQSQIYSIEQVVGHKVLARNETGAFEFRPFWSKDIGEDEARDLARFRVLDDAGYGNYVLMELGKDVPEPRLHLFLYGNRLIPLELSFAEYLEAVLETRGMYLWQQYHSALPEPLIVRDDFFENMRALFLGTSLADVGEVERSLAPSRLNVFLAGATKPDFGRLFDERVSDLRKRQDVKVLEYSRRPGVSLGSLVKATSALAQDLPEVMVEFYLAMNGVDLAWEGERAAGQVRVLPLESVLAGNDGEFKKEWNQPGEFRDWIWRDHDPPEERAFLQELRPIESVEGMNVDVALRFVRGREEPELYVLDENGRQSLPLEFSQYVKALLAFMGLDRWYYAFLGKEKSVVGTTALREQIEEYCPETDVAEIVSED